MLYTELCIEEVHVSISYNGKLSREKTLAFLAVSEPSVKVFSANVVAAPT